MGDRLERRRVDVCRVEHGSAATEQLDQRAFDVLVVQPRLPGRTGLELLRRLPHLDPPVVMLGREGNDAVIVRAFELGAADYITRPFAPDVAVARILRFLARSPRITGDGSGGR